MKICLFLDGYERSSGALYRNVGTGLLSSYRNQKAILDHLDITYTEHWEPDCDLLQANLPTPTSIKLLKAARQQGRRTVAWAHITAEDMVGVFRFMRGMQPLVRRYLRDAYGAAEAIFCPTDHTRDLLVSYGLDRERIHVISNGVNSDIYHADIDRRNKYRDEFGLDGVVIGTVALAVPRKGIATFLDLARRNPSHTFIWYGKIYKSWLFHGVPKNLPPNVRFTGFVDDAVAALNSLDIFLFPSHEENQGMAILEAAAVGLPILVRDLPAYRRWLVDSENCLVAPTEVDFAPLLDRLIEDESERARLSIGARDLADRESLVSVGRRVQDVYDSLLAVGD